MTELTTKQPNVITNTSQLKATLKKTVGMPEPRQALMVKPNYFSVNYVINPHMENNIGKVDLEKAYTEWEIYLNRKYQVRHRNVKQQLLM